MEGVSCKSLWTLVSGEGLKTEKGSSLTGLRSRKRSNNLHSGIIETELLAQKDLLKDGLLSFKPSNAQSLEKLKKSKDVGESWKDFVIKLAGVMRLEEEQAWQVLKTICIFRLLEILFFIGAVQLPSNRVPRHLRISCSTDEGGLSGEAAAP